MLCASLVPGRNTEKSGLIYRNLGVGGIVIFDSVRKGETWAGNWKYLSRIYSWHGQVFWRQSEWCLLVSLPAAINTHTNSPWLFLLLQIWISGNLLILLKNFPGGSDSKESACNVGDPDSIPWLGRSRGEANGSPFQYPCLESSRDRGAWRGTVHGVTKSRTRLSD